MASVFAPRLGAPSVLFARCRPPEAEANSWAYQASTSDSKVVAPKIKGWQMVSVLVSSTQSNSSRLGYFRLLSHLITAFIAP